MKPIKQLTAKETILKVKNLLKVKKNLSNSDFKVGNILLQQYTAKDKTKPYDRVPFILILRVSNTYILGLNFHWIPFKMRLWLVKYIIRLNKNRIKNNQPINFDYKKIKPLLKKLRFAPCIRLYIRKRIKPQGVVIPINRMIEIATLKMELITNVKEKNLYKMAIRH